MAKRCCFSSLLVPSTTLAFRAAASISSRFVIPRVTPPSILAFEPFTEKHWLLRRNARTAAFADININNDTSSRRRPRPRLLQRQHLLPTRPSIRTECIAANIRSLSTTETTGGSIGLNAGMCDNDHEVADPLESFRIGYVSDVEGHWKYFLEYVERSNVLDWEGDDGPSINDATQPTPEQCHFPLPRLLLRPNTHFIYGGDSVDKGPGDIRLCHTLVSLKRRYPDRVHLLVGNRDLNKLRLWSELSKEDMARPIEDIGRPFWNRDAPSLKEYLERIREAQKDPNHGQSLAEYNTRAERLRYMLKHTLGCPDTFEYRRDEIRILRELHGTYPLTAPFNCATLPAHATKTSNAKQQSPLDDVTDEDVVESFLHEVHHPDGSLFQYLQHASIVAIVGNTIFVHGAIDSLTMKYVPSIHSKFELPTSRLPSSTPDKDSTSSNSPPLLDGTIIDDVHEWANALNQYLKQGLQDYYNRPNWNDDRNSRGGESLLAIQNRPALWGRSIICNSYGDGGVIFTTSAMEERQEALHQAFNDEDPLAFEGIASDVMDNAPMEWLLEHGIQRIVVGHKPTGDCPAVLNAAYTGVEVVSADTSYASRRDLEEEGKTYLGHVSNNNRFGRDRGDAFAMVEIAGPNCWNNWLETSGTLACGTEYSNRFPLLGKNSDYGRKKFPRLGENANQFDSWKIPEQTNDGDSNLGVKLSDGWWIKAAVPPNYHLCRGYGRFVEYDVRHMKEVLKIL